MATTPTPNEIVREFYSAFKEPIHEGAPSATEEVISDERLSLKISLIVEEVSELIDAAFSDEAGDQIRNAWKYCKKNGLLDNPRRDLVEMLDAVLDIDVVNNGLAIETNMPIVEGLAEVHRGNMSKLDEDGNPIRSDGTDGLPKGKIIKGPNYIAPDLLTVLLEHGYEA